MTSNRSGDVSPIVEVEALEKVYRTWTWRGRRRVEALRGVDLTAYPGEVFGLLGPNGAGKTTLIKTLLGVIKPTRGRASLFGKPIGSSTARRRVGYLPEALRIDPHHTARSALRFYGRLSRMHEGAIRTQTDELLEIVGLRNRDRESVRRFSKGMAQRLGLAQALMHNPDLLILDEPTDGLDPVGRSEVRRIIDRLRESGKTIFLNSHILQEVELVCTRVAIMAGGRIRGMGTMQELSRIRNEERLVIDVDLASGGATDPARLQEALRSCLTTAVNPNHTTDDRDVVAERLPNEHVLRLQARFTDQAEVDAAVDTLRQMDASIVGLKVQRPSLEDTFLRLVDDSEAPLEIREATEEPVT